MDFLISLYISGIIATVLLYGSLYIYYRRLYIVEGQVASDTFQSLRAFGVSIFALGLVFPSAILLPSFLPAVVAFSLFGMVSSQMFIAFDPESRMRKIGPASIVLLVILLIESTARLLIVPYPLPPIGLIFVLSFFVIVAFGGALYVLRESPSPFTASMIVILVFTLIAGITATILDVLASPQFFLILIVPVIVAAAVVGSMLRPWRNIITLAMLGLIISTGPALFIAGYVAGNMTIFLFTASLTFALISLIIPLSFFLQQAVDTRASTALYISISLVSIGLLALTHGNNFAIANSAIGLWDETILFIDWLFGLLAVSAFTMASIASSFSANIRHASREIIIGFAAGLLVLGHPYVRWVEFDGELIQRWELDPLYLGVIALLAVSFMVFFKLSYQLWKAGSGRAGLRFVFFMFAALFLGIVAMFADNIPLDFLVPLLLLAGVMLILSSPRKNPFAQG